MRLIYKKITLVSDVLLNVKCLINFKYVFCNKRKEMHPLPSQILTSGLILLVNVSNL